MQGLARRLLAAASSEPPLNVAEPCAPESLRVVEKLRVSLATLVGAGGFASLLGRALVLANRDVPSLQSVKIGADGRLEGFEELATDTGAGALEGEAAVAITTHLLELLVTFIGESLTLWVVRETWPDASLDELH